MTIDFFVHPEHACYEEGRYPNREVYQQYRTGLVHVLELSEFPILITGHYPSESFQHKIPQENHLESASFYISEYPANSGEIHPKDWEKFVKLLSGREGEGMRIHGANFGECTEGFAVQLFAYLFRREHWHDWEFYPSYNGNDADFKREEELRMNHQKAGDFRKSKIRYGTALHPVQKKIKIIKTSVNPLSKFRNGNITYQLMDDQTLVYGK